MIVMLTCTEKISRGKNIYLYMVTSFFDEDLVKKAFIHSLLSLELLHARTEECNKTRIFLSISGYSMMRMIAHTCRTPLA